MPKQASRLQCVYQFKASSAPTAVDMQALRPDGNDMQAAIKAAGRETIAEGTPDVGGRAPLHVAAAEGSTEAVQALLDAGAPINGPDGRNRTPLLVCPHHRLAAFSQSCLPGAHLPHSTAPQQKHFVDLWPGCCGQSGHADQQLHRSVLQQSNPVSELLD